MKSNIKILFILLLSMCIVVLILIPYPKRLETFNDGLQEVMCTDYNNACPKIKICKTDKNVTIQKTFNDEIESHCFVAQLQGDDYEKLNEELHATLEENDGYRELNVIKVGILKKPLTHAFSINNTDDNIFENEGCYHVKKAGCTFQTFIKVHKISRNRNSNIIIRYTPLHPSVHQKMIKGDLLVSLKSSNCYDTDKFLKVMKENDNLIMKKNEYGHPLVCMAEASLEFMIQQCNNYKDCSAIGYQKNTGGKCWHMLSGLVAAKHQKDYYDLYWKKDEYKL